jgi:hypothetical protein
MDKSTTARPKQRNFLWNINAIHNELEQFNHPPSTYFHHCSESNRIGNLGCKYLTRAIIPKLH